MSILDRKIPTVVIGPPGTGKTTYILNKIEEYLDSGVGIDQWLKSSTDRRLRCDGFL